MPVINLPLEGGRLEAFRTGAPFAGVAMGVVPDILATAKALANGLPIGLTMVTEEISAAIPGGAESKVIAAT